MIKNKKRSINKIKIAIVILVFAAVILTVLELTNTTYLFHKRKATSGTIPTVQTNNNPPLPTKTSASGASGNSTSQNPNIIGATSPNSSNPKSPNPGSSLIIPFGSFVSNHNPTLSGSLSNEESVCNTTPGATCYIEFTQNSVVKKLPAETADSNGTVYWYWNVGQAGFTSGNWQITAVATLSGQSETAQDKINLDVQQ